MNVAHDPRLAPSVAILLTTYNGERFLVEQLDSIERQTHGNWCVYASDDGSTDGTLAILEEYQGRWGAELLSILRGPQKGFAANFMSLVTSQEIEADYFAFSDQDDIWFADKLERSLAALSVGDKWRPALYCSRTRLVDIEGRVIGHSPLFRKAPGFRNALVQSIAGANTMIFNHAARALLKMVPADAHVVSHDWLTYLLVTGCDGQVFYDPVPTVDYRQHTRNLVGTNAGVHARVNRAARMLRGTYRAWNRDNLSAIQPLALSFSKPNREALELFQQARESPLVSRLKILMKARLHHQTMLGNAGLVAAALLGKM